MKLNRKNIIQRPVHTMRGGGGGGGMGGCYIYDENLVPNSTLVTPDVVYNRGIDMNIPLTMDDGNTVNMWGFTDGGGGGMGGGSGTFPSAAMRVTQGQIVHSVLSVNMMLAHTIGRHRYAV